MWICGDWGQASPWSRDTGVKMVKGDDDVWVGELSLPRGTKFDIKILRSTVTTTSGGDNTWSAVRYRSTLNLSASHDFGEFTDNLIPNGSFDEGAVKWTPTNAIKAHNDASSPPNVGRVAASASMTSDTFVIPPSQTLRFTGYGKGWSIGQTGTVLMQVVSPQQQVLFESKLVINSTTDWSSFSKTFTTDGIPLECRVKLTNNDSTVDILFDSLSLVSP